jgi:acetylornithine/N-succinyldiaminopimelate aminotransferase
MNKIQQPPVVEPVETQVVEHETPVTELVETTGHAGSEWLARYSTSLMGVFGTPQRVLVRGAGCLVWDADGKEYLDLLGGIAVNALGHANPFVTSVISSQLSTLGHVSNFFTSPTQIALAEKLLALSNAPAGSKVFFTNSGTEANEAAFKLARRNAGSAGTPRTKIIALEGAFHGRTMGALALTAKEAYRAPFEPLPGGVVHIPFGDIEALEAAVDETVAAVFLEPIQGEAGVRPLPAGYLRAARELTTKAGALLILDEVQTGIGRTGKWLASEDAGIVPDAITLAKGLGGGFDRCAGHVRHRDVVAVERRPARHHVRRQPRGYGGCPGHPARHRKPGCPGQRGSGGGAPALRAGSHPGRHRSPGRGPAHRLRPGCGCGTGCGSGGP